MLILPTLVRASARLAARPLLKVPAAVSVLPSTLRSSRWYASSVDPDNNHMRGSTPASQLSDEYERLANNPEAMSAIENMIKVMKANGVDLTSFDQPPSMWQLVQLARNEDVKTASFAGKCDRSTSLQKLRS